MASGGGHKHGHDSGCTADTSVNGDHDDSHHTADDTLQTVGPNKEGIVGGICVRHHEELIKFCKTHEEDCCEQCIKDNHNDCPVVNLPEIHSQFTHFLERVKRIQSAIDDREEDLKAYSFKVKTCLELSKIEIQNIFTEIRKQVDAVEQDFLSKVDSIGEEEIAAISATLNQYISLKEQLEGIVCRGETVSEKMRKTCETTASNQPEGEALVELSPEQEEEVTKLEEQLNQLSEIRFEFNGDIITTNDDKIAEFYSNLEKVITIMPLRKNGKTDTDALKTA